MDKEMKIRDFEVPAHSTIREWAVYVIVAKLINDRKRFLYVGKVGDNREGCNPIISRIGNHFSYNAIHSQMRNNLGSTTDYNYQIFYATFGLYDARQLDKDKINERERQLNCYIQKKLNEVEFIELLNPYKGSGVSKNEKLKRGKLLTETDKEILKMLADKAIME